MTILEARHRCGGRIYPLPTSEFGYAAEGGPELIHGEAPQTRSLLREAGLKDLTHRGWWRLRDGVFWKADSAAPDTDRLFQALAELESDLPVLEFIKKHFWEANTMSCDASLCGWLRAMTLRSARASTFGLRDEWVGRGLGNHGRVVGGYGAPIEFLAAQCRRLGASMHLGVAVKAIETSAERMVARCIDGRAYEGDAAILAVPLPA